MRNISLAGIYFQREGTLDIPKDFGMIGIDTQVPFVIAYLPIGFSESLKVKYPLTTLLTRGSTPPNAESVRSMSMLIDH